MRKRSAFGVRCFACVVCVVLKRECLRDGDLSEDKQAARRYDVRERLRVMLLMPISWCVCARVCVCVIGGTVPATLSSPK
jgi:hypothetical protein